MESRASLDTEQPDVNWECSRCGELYPSVEKPDRPACPSCGDITTWRLPGERIVDLRKRLTDLREGDEIRFRVTGRIVTGIVIHSDSGVVWVDDGEIEKWELKTDSDGFVISGPIAGSDDMFNKIVGLERIGSADVPASPTTRVERFAVTVELSEPRELHARQNDLDPDSVQVEGLDYDDEEDTVTVVYAGVAEDSTPE